MTDDVLERELLLDPNFKRYSVTVIDEAKNVIQSYPSANVQVNQIYFNSISSITTHLLQKCQEKVQLLYVRKNFPTLNSPFVRGAC